MNQMNTHIKKKFLINFPCIFYDPGKYYKILKQYSLQKENFLFLISWTIDFHLFHLEEEKNNKVDFVFLFKTLKLKKLKISSTICLKVESF